MITICLPTRERPKRFAEMYESALSTATGQVEVVAVFDADDRTRRRYPSGPVYVVDDKHRNQSDLWNVAWSHATGDIAHLGADDLIYRTPGWDKAVERAFARWAPPIGMVYVNDLNPVSPTPFHGMRPSEQVEGRYVFAANPFCSREWIAAAGFFTPPFYKSWESDTWIYLLADGVSRAKYLHDVVIEHMHPMAGKGEMDATYQRGAWGNAQLRSNGWGITRKRKMRDLRKTQILKLTEAIQAGRR